MTQPWRQQPVDIVCCVDSSVSVGPEDFGTSVDFLRSLVIISMLMIVIL